jgi:hypothetical protein
MKLDQKTFKSIKKTHVDSRKKTFIKPTAGELKSKMIKSQQEYSDSLSRAHIETQDDLDNRKIDKLVDNYTQGQSFLERNLHIFPKAIQHEVRLKLKGKEKVYQLE